MAHSERWTVEAGRQLYFDGEPCLSVGREGVTEPTVADGATHLVAHLLNRAGATPDSIYEQHMGCHAAARCVSLGACSSTTRLVAPLN